MRAILTYHSVDPSGSPISVDRRTFRRQVEWLAEAPVEVTDVSTLLEMPDEVDAAALVFDDGFRNFATEAWPLLADLGLPATLFVVPGRVGRDNRWRGAGDEGVPDLDLLDWSELGRLAEEGLVLASHGMTHHRLSGANPERVRSELAKSRVEILERTGVAPAGFAYPYGDHDAFCRHVAAAHYDWACTAELAPLESSTLRYALPRLDMYYFRNVRTLTSWGTDRFRRRLSLRRTARRVRSAVRRDPRDRNGTERIDATDLPVLTASSDPATALASGEPSSRRARPAPAESPELSVIVPAHRGAEDLHESLPALLRSDLAREKWELIVVNDGTDPETLAVARRYADRIIALEGAALGPSYARNRGAEIARGDVLVFVDADVKVHEDTLRRFRDALEAHDDVAAVFGSYDDRPPGPGLVSTYRNLLHHQVHQWNAGEAETFWAGCGAVRRRVFEEAGGYDEWHFSRPQIEDIELGRRIRLRGHRILLHAEAQATHLKRWTFGEVLKSDLMHRGIPWMRLLLQEGESPGRKTLNLSARHRWCVALAAGSAAGVATSVLTATLWPLAAGASAAGVVVALNRDFYGLMRRREGWKGAVLAVPLHLTHYLSNGFSAVAGWVAHVTVGAPLPPIDAAAFREAGMDGRARLPSPPSDSLWYRDGD